MYPYLTRVVEDRLRRDASATESALKDATCGTVRGNWYYKKLLTNHAKRLVDAAGDSDEIPDIALKKMTSRILLASSKEHKNVMDKLASAESAVNPNTIEVSVEWRKSRTYGYIPTATVRAGGITTTAKAGGCGYDKESAAIAYAMNANASVLRVWYDHAERGGKFEYSVNDASKGYLPCMDGGCGMSALQAVFNALGYDMTSHHRKMYDWYMFTKRDKDCGE